MSNDATSKFSLDFSDFNLTCKTRKFSVQSNKFLDEFLPAFLIMYIALETENVYASFKSVLTVFAFIVIT